MLLEFLAMFHYFCHKNCYQSRDFKIKSDNNNKIFKQFDHIKQIFVLPV
jgi:hypothetical protein